MTKNTGSVRPNDLVNSVGGAIVARGFTRAGEYLRANTVLTEQEVRAIPKSNLMALRDAGFLRVFPKGPDNGNSQTEIFVVRSGSGKYDVIEGVKINDAPMTKDEAEALAGVKAPVSGNA